MASQTPITDWCLTNQDILKPQIQSLNWTREWLADYFDFEVILQVGSSTVTGRGTDKNQRLALEKAFAEAIERHFTRQNRLYYHGVAVHSDEKQAQINAQSEFYERSIFLTENWLTKGKFLQHQTHGDFDLPHDLEKKIWGYGYDITTHLLPDLFETNGTVYTSIISPSAKSPSFLGMAEAAYGFEAAAEKSLVEAVRGFVGYLHTEKCESPIPSAKGFINANHGGVSLLTDKGPFKTAPLSFAFTKASYFEPESNLELSAVVNGK